MARKREFDEDEVLEAAMRTFWQYGYESTSMQNLMDATGLAKGSIYKAFGDKHNLYMQALERYLNINSKRHRESLFSKASPLEGILCWFIDTFTYSDQENDPCKGCLALNSSLELSPHDDTVKERLLSHTNHAIGQLVARVEEGQASGEIRQDMTAADIAMLVGGFHLGATAAMGQILTKEDGIHLAEKLLNLLRAKEQ